MLKPTGIFGQSSDLLWRTESHSSFRCKEQAPGVTKVIMASEKSCPIKWIMWVTCWETCGKQWIFELGFFFSFFFVFSNQSIDRYGYLQHQESLRYGEQAEVCMLRGRFFWWHWQASTWGDMKFVSGNMVRLVSLVTLSGFHGDVARLFISVAMLWRVRLWWCQAYDLTNEGRIQSRILLEVSLSLSLSLSLVLALSSVLFASLIPSFSCSLVNWSSFWPWHASEIPGSERGYFIGCAVPSEESMRHSSVSMTQMSFWHPLGFGFLKEGVCATTLWCYWFRNQIKGIIESLSWSTTLVTKWLVGTRTGTIIIKHMITVRCCRLLVHTTAAWHEHYCSA